MPQRIFAQIEQVSLRRHRRRLLSASCWALMAALVAVLGLMGLDRAFVITDPVGRTLLTFVLLMILAWIASRWYRSFSKGKTTPLQVAQEIEDQYPHLRDVMTSAWSFGHQTGDDSAAGSQSLRRAVVIRAAASADDVDWQKMVPGRPLRNALMVLVGLILIISVLVWCMPQMLRIGLTRLANPFSAAEWPRQHDLQFKKPPSLLATGDDLVLQLTDTSGRLPSSITMHYRTRRRGLWQEENQALAATTDSLEVRRLNVQQSLEYRATGGDHLSMPWQTLEVVTPPHVETIQITVYPPAYTELPEQLWDKNTAIIAGSKLELKGRTNQAVERVVLKSKNGTQLSAELEPDGHLFRIEPSDWSVSKSDTFALHLTTAAGLTVRSKTELALEVVVDQPPRVFIDEPKDDLAVLPSAAVPLVIMANDDLALHEIVLLCKRSDRMEKGGQKISLWRAEEKRVKQQQVDYLLELNAWSLKPGDRVEVSALATDAQPSTGRTMRALELQVVSEDELWQQIHAQQERIVETLIQLSNRQNSLRKITAEWMEFPEWTASRWSNASHEMLFRQRQITDTLTAGEQSVLAQLAKLRQTIWQNRLARPELSVRLHSAQERLRNLADGPLAKIQQSLVEVVRQTQFDWDRQNIAPLISATVEQQRWAADGFRQAIELLMPANVMGRFERELVAIKVDAASLAEHCQVEITQQLFPSSNASPSERATLDSAVRRQRALAGRLAELMINMTQASQHLADEEPTIAARLAATVTLAQELGTQTTLRSAATHLAQQRLGRSASLQQQSLIDLAKLLTCLVGSDGVEAVRRFQQLQQVERKLIRLQRQVASLEQELGRRIPGQQPLEAEGLRSNPKELAAQADEAASLLERLRIPHAAAATNEAASQLRHDALDRENIENAKQQLETARQQLATERRRQQIAIARMQMAQLDQKLIAWIASQQTIQQEMLQLEHLREETGQLSDTQNRLVQQLAQRQESLQYEVIQQADQLTSLPVFSHLMMSVSETMQTIKDRLDQADLRQPTRVLARQVIDELTQLSKVVRQELSNLSEKQAPGDTGKERNAGDKPQEQTLQLALGQLKLLKSLQRVLREKTRALEKRMLIDQESNPSAEELAREQQQLTELARQLLPVTLGPDDEQRVPKGEQSEGKSFDSRLLPSPNQEIQP